MEVQPRYCTGLPAMQQLLTGSVLLEGGAQKIEFETPTTAGLSVVYTVIMREQTSLIVPSNHDISDDVNIPPPPQH
jgi:hypothetical protein